jgi:chromate transporter
MQAEDDSRNAAPLEPRVSLLDLFLLYLRLGLTAFGGPAVHIALMEDEAVRRRRWVTREEFIDMIGVTNLIPGPNSTEMAMHVGLKRGGAAGLALAGWAFILPSAIIVTLIAWLYARYGTMPEVQPFIDGVQPAVAVILAGAVWRLGGAFKARPSMLVLMVVAAVAILFGWNEIAVLFALGFLGMLWERRNDFRQKRGRSAGAFLGWSVAALSARSAVAVTASGAGAAAATASAPGLLAIFLYFLKIGAVMYGSGYVLFAFLQGGVVERLQWITNQQLVDAIAAGQLTPGPVSTTATFIGYLLGGAPGAAVATVGIFLPGFIFVALVQPAVPWLRARRWPASFLDSVSAAAVGLMAGVCIVFARESLDSARGFAIAAAAAIALFKFNANTAWIILGAAAVNGVWDLLLG